MISLLTQMTVCFSCIFFFKSRSPSWVPIAFIYILRTSCASYGHPAHLADILFSCPRKTQQVTVRGSHSSLSLCLSLTSVGLDCDSVFLVTEKLDFMGEQVMMCACIKSYFKVYHTFLCNTHALKSVCTDISTSTLFLTSQWQQLSCQQTRLVQKRFFSLFM